jgi:hypothetical protein
MRVLPFERPGRFWRGGLHAHSDHSDGAFPPDEVVRRYQEAGYDFVTVTDHFRAKYGYPLTDTRPLRTARFTTLLGAELHAPRTELGAEWHIIAVGLPLGFAPPDTGETGPQLARRARAAGAFIGMAHPAASLLTVSDAESLDAADAVEVYNAVAAYEERADSWHICDLLLTRGRRLTAYAADDAHFQPHDPPGCTSWVEVWAEALDPAALLSGLKEGHYYSSTGPQINSVELRDGVVVVQSSPVTRVAVTGGLPGKQVRTSERPCRQWWVPLDQLEASPYVRVTLIAEDGGRAWTNPIWLEPVAPRAWATGSLA